MGPLLAEKGKRRQIGLINFEQREIGFLVLADESRFKNAALPDRHLAGGVAHGKRQGNANALCAFHHMSVGHDVAVGVDDHSRAHRVLANDESSLRSISPRGAGPYPVTRICTTAGETLAARRLQRAVELDQDAGRLDRFGIVRPSVAFFFWSGCLGRLLAALCLSAARPRQTDSGMRT